MMNLLTIFLLKLADTSIGACKTIFTIKGDKFLASLSQAVSNVFYLLMMSKLMKSTDALSIFITSAGVFLGQYYTQALIDKISKDKVWKISATAKTEEGKNIIVDSLNAKDINFRILKAEGRYTKAYVVEVFCETKEETSIVKKLFSEYQMKHHTIELKGYSGDEA
jgi:uncharacterized protein YebE (UPF0316 family)